MLYFIIDADGNVGHPTKKADMIRRWLKTGRAKIKDRGADWMILKITKKIDREKTIYDVCQGWASTQGTVITANHSRVKKRDVIRFHNNGGLTAVG